MFNIKLHGYYIGERGEKSRTIVSDTICSECMDRLKDSLGEFIDLKEVEHIGNVFSWSKRKEDMAEWISVNDRLPEESADKPVNIVWKNTNQTPYYESIRNKPYVGKAYYYNGEWWLFSYVEDNIVITHWMPTPDAPIISSI